MDDDNKTAIVAIIAFAAVLAFGSFQCERYNERATRDDDTFKLHVRTTCLQAGRAPVECREVGQ